MSRNREQPVTDFRSDYATPADYCNALAVGADSLYLLAFLLTTNHKDAEYCFVAAVDQTFRSNTVSREWVPSWIRRTVITQAIRTVFNPSNQDKQEPDRWCAGQRELGSRIDAITRLGDRDRFIFVMSVLERYSDHECSLLLGCRLGTVIESRTHALQALPGLNTSEGAVWQLQAKSGYTRETEMASAGPEVDPFWLTSGP